MRNQIVEYSKLLCNGWVKRILPDVWLLVMIMKSELFLWSKSRPILNYYRDVLGAQKAGMQAALLRRDDSEPLRPGAKAYSESEGEINVINDLNSISTML